ncbi:BTAD domain-containing putative transcriptional regulator [Hamadaea sp. NPDC051192]|uniref:AfsR/SARP family transcriptional regulator n=1 Tax=Hamadaea sp. NPDC051192 TaxID=3154940 RepID=UPI00341EE971
MRFRLLGGVAAYCGDEPLTFNRRRERGLLGLLLLAAGQPVTMDRLIDVLWAEPPEHARRTIHSHVARVRAALRQADPAITLTAVSGGYALAVAPDAVDVHRFRSMVSQAREEADPGTRAERLAAALAVWTGEPFGEDLPALWRSRLGADLRALRDSAEEQWLAALLEAGRADDALVPLAQLIAADPGNERLTELQMTALYRTGRRTEALGAYSRARGWLQEHLGLDPSPGLQAVHQAVLRDHLPVERPKPTEVPRQLPAPTTGFVGRDRELADLGKALGQGEPIVMIFGSAGIGKTTLATEFAQRHVERFPDGQIFLPLQGHGPTTPRPPTDALAMALTALGVRPTDIPGDAEPAGAMLRTLLAGKRVLLVLDDAVSAEQVRPLLPGSAGCLTVVTSRGRLAGLSASHGVYRIALPPLPQAEALSLLSRHVGAQRIAAEPEAAESVAQLCAYLPLAMRVAAATLVCHPLWTVADLAASLRTDPLGALEIDGERAVHAAFELSYRRLDPQTRHLFQLLGVIRCIDIGVPAAAALTRDSPELAARRLDRLAEAHLAEEHASRRYTMHDLLRAIAHERAEAEISPDESRSAQHRLADWYAARSAAAATVAFPGIQRLPEQAAWAMKSDQQYADQAEALRWFDTERANLMATVLDCAADGPRSHAWLIADAMRPYLQLRVDVTAWTTVARAGLDAARAEGDAIGQAAALLSLGSSGRWSASYDEALAQLDAGARLAREAGWPGGLATIYNNAAILRLEQRDASAAADLFQQAAQLYEEIGDQSGLSRAVGNLALVSKDLGRLREAIEYIERALSLPWRSTGAGVPLNNLANLHRLLGDLDTAHRYATEALVEYRREDSAQGEAVVHDTFALIARDRGDLDTALDLAQTAYALLQPTPIPRFVIDVLNTMGTVYTEQNRPAEALDWHRRAVETNNGQVRYQDIQAHLGLATAYWRLGDLEMAESHARQALGLARDAGFPLWEGDALISLAEISADLGEQTTAQAYASQAWAIHQRTESCSARRRLTRFLPL